MRKIIMNKQCYKLIKFWADKEVSEEHKHLLSSGEEQSIEDIKETWLMLPIQFGTLTDTKIKEDESRNAT